MKLQLRFAFKCGSVSVDYNLQLCLVVHCETNASDASFVPDDSKDAACSMFREENETKFPEFALEKEFQCHNTQLVKEVVCKTIQKFVKNPQDVRLAITVSFQPHITGNDNSHEQEAVATVEVDKPGNFYPGGQEQRVRNKELEVLRQVEKAKQQERREMRRLAREEEERKRRKTETGVKRPSGGAVHERARMTRVAPPLPFKAETRRLPTGEMYAVREWVYSYTEKEPVLSLPVTSSVLAEPMIVRETKLQAYEHWHLTPKSEPDSHAAESQGRKEDKEALEKCDIEPKGEPTSADQFTAGVTKAKAEDMEKKKPFTSFSGPPQKKEMKKQKQQQKKRPILNVRKISVVEPKVYGELVKSPSGGPNKQTVNSQPVIIFSQEGQSKLHAQPISTQTAIIPCSAPPPEVEVESDILNSDQQMSVSSPASTDNVDEGSLHEFKTPPDSSSALNSPVLPAKTVEDGGVVKPTSEVPASALTASLPQTGEKESTQKAKQVQDVTSATTSSPKPLEEVKVTQTEQASTMGHFGSPSLSQKVAKEQKKKIERHLPTLIQSVRPSGLFSAPTEGPQTTESASKQQVETPVTLPLAAFPEAEKEEKQKKALEAAQPSTAPGTIEPDQSKITKLPQLQATPAAFPSTSRSEEEDEQHKVASGAPNEASHIVTTTTQQIVKEEKLTKLLPAPTISLTIPPAPLPVTAKEEKPKEVEVLSSAVSVEPTLKIGEDNKLRKEPAPVPAILSAALPGSAEKEVKPNRAEVLPALPILDKKTKKDVEPHSLKTLEIPSKISLTKPLKKSEDLIEEGQQEPYIKFKEKVNEQNELYLTKAESTPPIASMSRVAQEFKQTKPGSEEGAASTFRYTIRSEGSQESEEEEKAKSLLRTPPQLGKSIKVVQDLKTMESKRNIIQPSPESTAVLPERAKEDALKNIKPQTVTEAQAQSAIPIVPLKIPEKSKAKELEQKGPILKYLPTLPPVSLPDTTDVKVVPKIGPSTVPLALTKSVEEEITKKVEDKLIPSAISPTKVPLKAVEVLNHVAPTIPTISKSETRAKTLKSEQLMEAPAPVLPSVLRKSEQEAKEKKMELPESTKSQSPHRPTILPFKIGADVKVTEVKPKQPITSSTTPTAISTGNVDWTKPEGFSLDVRKSQPLIQSIPSPKALEEVKLASLELQEPIHVEDSVVLALSSSKETEKTRSPLPVASLAQKEEAKPEEVLHPIISIAPKKMEFEIKATSAISPTSLPSPMKEKKMKFEPTATLSPKVIPSLSPEVIPTLSPKVIKDKKHFKRKIVHQHAESQPSIPVVTPTKIEEKLMKSEPRRPSVEEMNAVRELGSPRDDATDRDGLSLETIDVHSVVDLPQHKTSYIAMPDDTRVETKGSANIQGSIKLKDDGKSPKVLAYINVG